ncbi:MAG: hypothetical protein AABZ12_14830 [Planctomycetota bacterium]
MALQSATQRKLLISFILSIAACGLVGIYCLLQGQMGNLEWRILGTTSLVAAASILGLAAAVLWDRKRWPPLGLLGMLGQGPALVFVLPLVWLDWSTWQNFPDWRDFFERAAPVAWVIAIALPHVGLLSLGRLHRSYEWIRRWTVIMIAALGLLIIYLVLVEPNYYSMETWMRLVGILSIGVVCGTLAVPILHRVSAIRTREAVRTVELRVSLTCPRCAVVQEVPVGRSTCAHCSLRFSIEIEEEQCPTCGYPLYQLSSAVCPECGTEVVALPSPADA